jgi:hypothetical protein
MRLFFIVVIFGLISSGCSSAWYIKKARQKCPECFQTIKKDTTIVIDTTFMIEISDYIEIDTAPIFKYDTIIINNIQYLQPSFDTIIDVNEGLTAKIWLEKGRLGSRFDIDSSLIFQLQDSIDVLLNAGYKIEYVEKESKGFERYFVYIAIILGLILLIFIFKK